MRKSRKLNAVVSRSPWVRVVEYHKVVFDQEGFRHPSENVDEVLWRSIVRVAMGYQIHPIAIADWDFWAFQTDDLTVTYWVATTYSDAFSEEVRQRYGSPKVPSMGEWMDSEFCIRAYVVWPSEYLGTPLYRTVKRHWWSRGRLAYTETGQQGVQH